MALVVDASVALAWWLPDEHSDYANSVLGLLEIESVQVPAFWAVEIANGLLVAERRGRLSPAAIAEVRAMLSDLPLVVDQQEPVATLGAVLDLARAHRLTVYDAAYLELAMRTGLPLATLDADLRRAARDIDVATFDQP